MSRSLASVFTDSDAHFDPRSIQAKPLDPELSHCERELGAGTLTLRNRCLTVSWGYEIRLLHMRSPKIEIVTAFAFPGADTLLPLYGMELVALGQRPIVGVIDLLDMEAAGGLGRGGAIMAGAHQAFPDLPYSEDQPDWFRACRSGQDFFMRPEAMGTLLRMVEVHHHVMSRIAALSAQIEPATDARARATAITQYKRHHRDNSPGLPLLNRVFGEAWTDAYLDGYLFA